MLEYSFFLRRDLINAGLSALVCGVVASAKAYKSPVTKICLI